MCTLTIIPCDVDSGPRSRDGRQAAGVRMACNRDESRLRASALAPQLRRFAERQALMPVDPVSDGTWIAASDAPLAMALMNVYAEPIKSVEQLIESRLRAGASRGTIIPHALAADNVGEALKRARDLELAQFEPFRLVIVGRHQFAQVVWSAGRLDVTPVTPMDRPLFFTSSGLGDAVVANPRRELFDEYFVAGADWPAAQDAFHRHVWPGRELASVWMTRPEARTVSLTVVEMGPQDVRMRYYARPNDDSSADQAEALSAPIATGRGNVTS
jgi:Transport and Golgi organisation 2